MKFGKKLYHSSSITSIKVMGIMVIVTLFLNLIFQTLGQVHYLNFLKDLGLSLDESNLNHILHYHIIYPEELILYLLTVFIPAVYYGFIRGVSFYEKGLVVNKGLPFFIAKIPYQDIASYQVIHPRHLMSVLIRETQDEMLFSIRDMNRVLAILDQNGIKGNLTNDEMKANKAPLKLAIFFILIAILIAFIQYSAVIRDLFR